MRSLRARVFVTVALVLAAATVVSGLLSRRATLVEERQVLGSARLPPLGDLTVEIQRAYDAGGWAATRPVLEATGGRLRARLLALDANNQPVAASSPLLDDVTVKSAGPDGRLSIDSIRHGSRATLEMRGIPTMTVRLAGGQEAGRVYLLPGDAGGTVTERPLVPEWIATTLGTAAVALLIAFALSGRILRPVSELTSAARRMREGDLDVRVTANGDDEIGRLANAFNEMAERLAQTERTKRQLVSDVAHELRSPLTNLRCGLEAMQDGLVAPDRARIDALHSEALLLQRLVADLQDLALADAGGLVVDRQSVDVEAVIRQAIGTDVAGARVIVTVDETARVVRADKGRLEQMLRNLIDNARRHTPVEGTIDIRASREGDDVLIVIADTGSGIAPEHLPHVFDRFYRADPSRDRATGGAGLGLAIVRRLADAQAGTVTASSGGAGLGATFTVRMPSSN